MKNFIKLIAVIMILMATSVVISVHLVIQYQWRLALIIFASAWAISVISMVIYTLYAMGYFDR